ncbi:thiol-disulfide isomerase/thioredoxin [Microbacteriaceae bacterium SG_E_30_P1]|uniref:Thiol-disulfide isomerase/thioredoxin n=1 Tax=Antiquaquibacter oligotrophicus TaxID=2880260 RepID=A0ABT6KL07_9MICO|nr:thioredoxin family protein [Antiquaquibacter oligotrophicus]MDH6180680.1 thiol-disulfide isomerase/thioredoxin [Antiquaquibacter oligotrophicus]UDF13593.1 thioredoxin family protein [Antiquaquibacter oligotrophicus]
MSPLVVAAALIVLVSATTAVGLLWRHTQGRAVRVHDGSVVRASDLPGLRRLPRGVTLVQFSTDVCAPCRSTHAALDRLASENDRVTHIDVDITTRPDIASRFRVLQTPTTLVVDERGAIRARIGGAPRLDALQAELDRALTA